MGRFSVRFYAFASLFSIIILLNTAGIVWIHHDLTRYEGPTARVLWALPDGQADEADRFTLILDTPLADRCEIGEPLLDPPFVIDPDPGGVWTWAAPDRIEFVLDQPLKPGRRFSIRPVYDFEARTGVHLAGDDVFCFETAPLTVTDCRTAVYMGELITIELAFNQPVDPLLLLRHLEVKDLETQAELDPILVSRESSDVIVFRVRQPVSDELEVKVNEELTGDGGTLNLACDYRSVLRVHPEFGLCRASVSRPSLTRPAEVYLYFNQVIDPDLSQPEVALQPEVKDLTASVKQSFVRLDGDFEPGTAYTAVVKGNLVSRTGKVLKKDQEVLFEVPDYNAQVRFPLDRGVISPQGNLDLDIEVVGVPGLSLDVHRVHANNLLNHLQGGRLTRTARQIESSLELPLSRIALKPETVALDLKGLLKKPLGVYAIKASVPGSRWTTDEATITVSDLAITAKEARGELFLWITSLRTGRPVSDVEVEALTYNNQALARGMTTGDGIARLRLPVGLPDGPAWVVLVQKGDDLNYLRLDENPWVFDEKDLSGREIPQTYDIMLYTERGVYRPGDTIHLTGIIRDRDGDTPEPFPIQIVQIRPDGQETARKVVTPVQEMQGVFQIDFATWLEGQTGVYRFRASLPGADEILGGMETLVEAFEPLRIEMAADLSKALYLSGENPEVAVHARYLFDQPAADLPLYLSGEFYPVPFVSDRFPDYSFESPGRRNGVAMAPVETRLDPLGQGHLNVDVGGLDLPGRWEGRLFATVTEPGGRSVSRPVRPLVDRASRHVGMRLPEGRLFPARTPFVIDWVARTDLDEGTGGEGITFSLFRVEFDTTLQKVNDQYVWKSLEHPVSVWEEPREPINAERGQGNLEIFCPKVGKYRVVAHDETTDLDTVAEFYASSEESETQSLALNRPERMEILCDRERYAPGSEATLLIRSPFPGTLLLAMETDEVHRFVVEKVFGNSAQIRLPVDASLRGGAFVTATLVRPVDPGHETWLPHRALGLTRLFIDHREHRLPVILKAPQKARPGEEVTVTVRSGIPCRNPGPGVVHLFAVDEGILLASGFQTPDPAAHFFEPWKAVVESHDLFGRLLPDFQRPGTMARIGSGRDRDGKEALRRNPVPAKRRESAVIFHEAALLGADGTRQVTCKLPDYTGELRWMAVLVDGDGYGSAEAAMTVSAPLLVEASWPRFAAPGDQFHVPVKVFNTSDDAMEVRLNVEIEGEVEACLKEADRVFKVEPGAPVTVWLEAMALETGPARAAIKAFAGEETACYQQELSVRPVAPVHGETSLVTLEAGETFRIAPPEKFRPGTVSLAVHVSSRPDIHLKPAVKGLIDYPYGCIEQTTSRCRALLCASRILGDDRSSLAGSVDGMIRMGITRLSWMRTLSGGLSYWPGDYRPCLFGTAYAARFLVDARAAGYTVPETLLGGLVPYLEDALDTEGENLKVEPELKAMICWVLADLGKPARAWMTRLSQRPEGLDREGRAYLASAWIALGRKEEARALLTEDLMGRSVLASLSGRITSKVRQDGVLLRTLLDLDPDHPWVPILVRRLEEGRKNGVWNTTLDNATALDALARYQESGGADGACFEGTVTGPKDAVLAFDHGQPASKAFFPVDEPLCLTTTGTGKVYLTVTAEGLLADDGIAPFDQGLRVRRTWRDKKGMPLNPMYLKVGELVQVTLSLEALVDKGEVVPNVAIVDALPGGMEVENPRLVSAAGSWGSGGPGPDRVEFLDDRVLVFATARREVQTYQYSLRVVSAGAFDLPPVQASCMYDSAFASLSRVGERAEVTF